MFFKSVETLLQTSSDFVGYALSAGLYGLLFIVVVMQLFLTEVEFEVNF